MDEDEAEPLEGFLLGAVLLILGSEYDDAIVAGYESSKNSFLVERRR